MKAFLIIGVLLIPTIAHAQSDTVAVSYDLNVYPPGATVPSTRVVAASTVQCDLATAPTNDSVNPTTWWFKKLPTDATWCKVDDTTRLNNLPVGSYNGAVIGVNAAGVRGEETPRVPFTRTTVNPPKGPPAVSDLRYSK